MEVLRGLYEWTTGPFFASTLSKDGCDYLGLGFKHSQPRKEPRSRDGLSDFNREFYSEFLCLEADEEDTTIRSMYSLEDGEHIIMPNPQDCQSCQDGDHRKRYGEKRLSDTPGLRNFFPEKENQERLA